MSDSPRGTWQRTVLPRLAPAQSRSRRAVLPGLMAAVVAVACGALGVLGDPTPPAERPLIASVSNTSAAAALTTTVLEELPPRPLVKRDAPAAGAVAAAKSATQPRRVSRSRRAPAASTRQYVCPVAGRRHFVDSWGDRRSGGRRHPGTDIMARHGTPLLAVTSGRVRTARSGSGGISLYLRGTDGVEYFYAHNSRNSVRSGQWVRAGQVIAYVGSSGNARGIPHLHFERHPGGGGAVNPYRFLSRIC